MDLYQSAVQHIYRGLAYVDHGAGELRLEQLQDGLDAIGTIAGKAPHEWPAHQHGLGAECQGFDDVRAATKTPSPNSRPARAA